MKKNYFYSIEQSERFKYFFNIAEYEKFLTSHSIILSENKMFISNKNTWHKKLEEKKFEDAEFSLEECEKIFSNVQMHLNILIKLLEQNKLFEEAKSLRIKNQNPYTSFFINFSEIDKIKIYHEYRKDSRTNGNIIPYDDFQIPLFNKKALQILKSRITDYSVKNYPKLIKQGSFIAMFGVTVFSINRFFSTRQLRLLEFVPSSIEKEEVYNINETTEIRREQISNKGSSINRNFNL
ncbi:MAG: hypothetical protein J0H68_04000 [Sphingobacteriia bacterium]|nr:hypothetical protein [Sphingobacteriia bacterium]